MSKIPEDLVFSCFQLPQLSSSTPRQLRCVVPCVKHLKLLDPGEDR